MLRLLTRETDPPITSVEGYVEVVADNGPRQCRGHSRSISMTSTPPGTPPAQLRIPSKVSGPWNHFLRRYNAFDRRYKAGRPAHEVYFVRRFINKLDKKTQKTLKHALQRIYPVKFRKFSIIFTYGKPGRAPFHNSLVWKHITSIRKRWIANDGPRHESVSISGVV